MVQKGNSIVLLLGVLQLCAIFMGVLVSSVFKRFGVFTKLEYNDQHCTLLPGIGPSSEDLVVVDNNLVLVSSGDIDRIYFRSGKQEPSEEGGIFAIIFDDYDEDNADPIRTVKVPLEGFPSTRPFHPHGLYFSNKTNHLYAISHECGVRTLEAIEVFQLVRETKEAAADEPELSSAQTIKLVHVTSIESESFPLGALNNVIEGAYLGEVYATQWLPSATSDQCIGREPFWEDVTRTLKMALGRTTKVHRCTWSDSGPPVCHVVADGLKSANGITVDTERKHVFVVDNQEPAIVIYKRNNDDNGSLKPFHVIPLPYPPDNVEFDPSSRKLMLGTLPLVYQVLSRLQGDSSTIVSGGMMTIDLPASLYDDAANDNDSSYRLEEVLVHDGSKLSEISSAVFVHGKILLGSPPSDGVLVCPIPDRPIWSTLVQARRL